MASPTAKQESVASSSRVARGHAVYVVPSFLDESECDQLMAAASHHIGTDPKSPKLRLAVTKLADAQALCDALIRRTLALVEDQLPALGQTLFGQSTVLADLDVRFSLNEPAVNVYGATGDFGEHEDGHMLTMLVPLSQASAFEGGGTPPSGRRTHTHAHMHTHTCTHGCMYIRTGGTAFWPTDADAESFSVAAHDETLHEIRDMDERAKHVMLPSRGTLLLFVGSVTHAGVAVRSGERMVCLWRPSI